MTTYKAASSATIYKGYWFDFYTRRVSKRAARKISRHALKAETRKALISASS